MGMCALEMLRRDAACFAIFSKTVPTRPERREHIAMVSRLFACVCAGWCCAALAADHGGILNVIVEGPTTSASTALSNEFATVRRDARLLRESISRQAGAGADRTSRARTAVGLLGAQSADVAALPLLVEQVDAGGSTALRALKELCALALEPASRVAVLHSGAVRAAETLLKRPSSEDSVRAAAGGLLSLLSNMPVASSIADPETGGAASVDIVMPRPSRVYSGSAASFLSTQNQGGVLPSEYERETQAPMIWINLHKPGKAQS